MTPLFVAVGLNAEEWAAPDHRDRRWMGSFQAYLDFLGLDAAAAARADEIRTELTRSALQPVQGTPAVLDELHARGLRLGLVSNCSGEVGELWEESAFGGKFDAVVLSADVGICKPAPQIYRLVLERLGHSDELAGAEAVGMRAVQIGSSQPWDGERIASIPQVLELF